MLCRDNLREERLNERRHFRLEMEDSDAASYRYRVQSYLVLALGPVRLLRGRDFVRGLSLSGFGVNGAHLLARRGDLFARRGGGENHGVFDGVRQEFSEPTRADKCLAFEHPLEE